MTEEWFCEKCHEWKLIELSEPVACPDCGGLDLT